MIWSILIRALDSVSFCPENIFAKKLCSGSCSREELPWRRRNLAQRIPELFDLIKHAARLLPALCLGTRGWEAVRARINGVELVYEVFGEGVPLMTLHGGPGLGSRHGDRETFLPLTKLGLKLVCFDQRGSGESEGRPPYSHEQWVADIEGLRQHLGLGKMVLAGGSYGGHLALEYALRHQENLYALILRDTAASNRYQQQAMERALASGLPGITREMLTRLFEGRVRDDEDFRRCYEAILPLYEVNYDPERGRERLARIIFRHETHNWAFSRNQPGFDLTARLPEIRVPTLVLCGRHDWITPLEASEEIARLIPGARLVVFENSGHSPQFEEREKFLRVVQEFLLEVVPGLAR